MQLKIKFGMIIVWGSKTSRAAKEKTMDTVFFDMDGTLIDTEKYYNVCWCEAIAKFGYTITKVHIEKRSWKKCLNEMALL